MILINICFFFMSFFSINIIEIHDTTASLSGHIFDRRGMPISNAQITVSKEGLEKKAASNKDGKYTVPDLPKGLYFVDVTFPGFRGSKKIVNLKDSEIKILDIGLEVGAISDYAEPTKISIIVQSPDGKKIENVTVILLSPFDSEIVDRGVSDKNGKYQFRLQTGGQFILYAYKPGFKVSTKSINLTSNDIIETFLLSPLKTS